jgi:uncharacterized repeat protein (TIGR03803 family)
MKKIILSILSVFICLTIFAQKQFWGVTSKGGQYGGAGVIFKTDSSGNKQTVQYTFKTITASNPLNTNLIESSDGKLYGMSNKGGAFNKGVIFQYESATNTYTHKFHFDGDSTGGNPNGSLIQATDGMLYGMTSGGGVNNWGVIFKFIPLPNIH